MNREDIIRMAREAGFITADADTCSESLADFAALVAAAVLAEPEPKPVAWMEAPHGAIRANPLYRMIFPSELLAWSIPLYTHPPKARDWAADAIRERGEIE
jgi:hypothetical protein